MATKYFFITYAPTRDEMRNAMEGNNYEAIINFLELKCDYFIWATENPCHNEHWHIAGKIKDDDKHTGRQWLADTMKKWLPCEMQKAKQFQWIKEFDGNKGLLRTMAYCTKDFDWKTAVGLKGENKWYQPLHRFWRIPDNILDKMKQINEEVNVKIVKEYKLCRNARKYVDEVLVLCKEDPELNLIIKNVLFRSRNDDKMLMWNDSVIESELMRHIAPHNVMFAGNFKSVIQILKQAFIYEESKRDKETLNPSPQSVVGNQEQLTGPPDGKSLCSDDRECSCGCGTVSWLGRRCRHD